MKKKLILTSIVAVAVATPAIATTNTVAAANWTGTMLEDTTYTGSATQDKTGVYEGNVTAEAYYNWEMYDIAAGTYWPASTEWDSTASPNPAVVQCPANSFCAGMSNVHYETYDQGKTACSTVGDHTYTSSAAGASAETDCFKTCTTQVANIAHATSVAGNDYYGAGVDTCYATACENGYHTETPSSGGSSVNLNTIFGSTEGSGFTSVDNDGNNSDGDAMTYGLTTGANSSDKNKFVVDFGNLGRISGHGVCSNQSGQPAYDKASGLTQTPSTESSLTGGMGQSGSIYCWCKVETYTPYNSTEQNLSTNWFFEYDYGAGGENDCASYCAQNCAGEISNVNADLRTAAFAQTASSGSGTGLAYCAPNTINITWRGADAADVTANNAGTALYAGDINTPVKAKHQAGKSFAGWRFLANNPQTGSGTPTTTPYVLGSGESMNQSNINSNGTLYMPYVAPVQQ